MAEEIERFKQLAVTEREHTNQERKNNRYLRDQVNRLERELDKNEATTRAREEAQAFAATAWHFTPLRGGTWDTWTTTTLHRHPREEGDPAGHRNP
eukprot:CAMPEP_0196575880 /NCGR_PEP_ID=MMETSP1081-20130531/5271_1 /TAXON_ID=36882 /ORGANISM="Pyramimonas amylifera, Strain CCMP720" /LENGTH=95 /DNA_ID=CAMNT_0041894313 /DNA_START=195 /DNA_END=479 /DNA_ORIENTATION=+